MTVDPRYGSPRGPAPHSALRVRQLMVAHHRLLARLTFCVVFVIVSALPLPVNGKMVQKVVWLHGRPLYLERHQDNHPKPIKMGMDPNCDDGKTNLTLDWPDPGTLFCSRADMKYPIYKKLQNKKECINLPANYHTYYSPDHYCMFTKVTYDHIIPVVEGHRPVWPTFGEYYHVPRQRYLHSVEHGSVVMLYHPCASEHLVARLRSLVTRCVRKYVISREPLLDPNHPIALATWGCRLLINHINDIEIVDFIKDHALKGPEAHLEKEGNYNHTLIRQAAYPPGMLESPSKPPQGQKMTICPAESLDGHFKVYDKEHEAPTGVDSSKHAGAFAFLNDANSDGRASSDWEI